MKISNLTVTITGIGADSLLPDSADAVDADVLYDGAVVGSVTLLPDEWHGELNVWGDCLSCWASERLISWLDGILGQDDLGDTPESENMRNMFRDEIAPLVQLTHERSRFGFDAEQNQVQTWEGETRC